MEKNENKTGIESATVKSKEVKDTLDSLTKEIKETLLYREEDYQIKHYANLQKKYERIKESLEEGIATEKDIESWLWNVINTLLKDHLKFSKEIIKPIKSILPLFRKLQDAGVEGRVQERLLSLDQELQSNKEIIPLHNKFIEWGNEKTFIFDNIRTFLEFNDVLFSYIGQFKDNQNLQYAFTLCAFLIDDMMNCKKILKLFVDAVFMYSQKVQNVGFFLDYEIQVFCQLGYSNRSLQNVLRQYIFFSKNQIKNKDNGIPTDTIKTAEKMLKDLKDLIIIAEDSNQTLHRVTDTRHYGLEDMLRAIPEAGTAKTVSRVKDAGFISDGMTTLEIRTGYGKYKDSLKKRGRKPKK